MEMKKCTSITVSLIFIVLFSLFACSKKKIDPYKLCKEFYELNKDVNLEGLFYVQILGIREYSEFDKTIMKYNRIPVAIGIDDSISKQNIKLPVFRNGANAEERKLFFKRCRSSDIEYLKNKYGVESDVDIFDSYIKEVETIYSNYYQLKVPDMLAYTNVEVYGSGNYIEFVLYKNEEKRISYSCYFIRKYEFSNSRRKAYFDKLPRFDEHWCYDAE